MYKGKRQKIMMKLICLKKILNFKKFRSVYVLSTLLNSKHEFI